MLRTRQVLGQGRAHLLLASYGCEGCGGPMPPRGYIDVDTLDAVGPAERPRRHAGYDHRS
ncbi:hypothetical protein SLNWT_7211 [Streptomyces albus]|uniref:Uncharacterized protein n=1 Tax=Streptomyces albus (strain ATCC 21838 / DSM 41398 / FERM P-419 / JCM 4703 / NBRC 107858) TaxID=1081613 RepID=A0A0B5FAU0_STRA4|nr:hypothetical protein SLNWT_7211 [Streptomyces albus]AOU81889.1 hypothetical protein SLNHY_7198 [Streptomyces albus]AYN37575.1 hypothetical protein DUI70_7081 [Streptomyces albus]